MPLLEQEGELRASVGHSGATCKLGHPKVRSPATLTGTQRQGNRRQWLAELKTSLGVSAPGINTVRYSKKLSLS